MIPSIIILAAWLTGLTLFYLPSKEKWIRTAGIIFIIVGICFSIHEIIHLWIVLERPPIRTLGETRMWYSLFLAVTGMVVFFRWKLRWMPAFCLLVSGIFILINLIHPENFDKTLMPALQSPWFIPHVIVYIFAYALLAASALAGLNGLVRFNKTENPGEIQKKTDNIVYAGFSFLTFGLLFGALWAKQAWGHYWTWDPKETWAFLTWLVYLIYIHYRHRHPGEIKSTYWILILAFVILLICWFGVNYLPAAQSSVHVY